MSSSSTASASFTTSAANDQPTANSNQNSGSTTSSSLYLFTFLATLLLLLAVSCAIVARSLVVRRRFRRRVEEAIAAGLLPPTNAPLGAGFGVGGRKRDIGQKPVMWDSWLAPGEPKWSEIKPVSVKVISETLTGAGLPREMPKNSGRSATTSPNDTHAPRRRLLSAIPFPLTYRRSPSPAPTPKSTDTPNAEEKVDTSPAELQVAVLIAMPSPYRPQSWAHANPDSSQSVNSSVKGKERSSSMYLDGEEDLPEVVFGVTEVPWNPPTPSGDDNSLSNEKTS